MAENILVAFVGRSVSNLMPHRGHDSHLEGRNVTV